MLTKDLGSGSQALVHQLFSEKTVRARKGNMKFQNYSNSTADLKELMTATPMSPEAHAAIMRDRVAARRAVEDAHEAARQRRDCDLFTQN